MTNTMIILNERFALMDNGTIGTTGRKIDIEDCDGNKTIVLEPEEIHTYKAWQELGYQVKRGEKCIARFPIWKHVFKKVKDKDGNEENKEKMFLKESYFFKFSQVEKMPV